MYCDTADGNATVLNQNQTKKRRLESRQNNDPAFGSNIECVSCLTNTIFSGQKFLHLLKNDMESIFQTELWDEASHSSALFFPLREDIMVNTRNIEQFSVSDGNYFVAGQDGQYAKTVSGKVLHLWRFCTEKRQLYISRSFLFRNIPEFLEVQQRLERL